MKRPQTSAATTFCLREHNGKKKKAFNASIEKKAGGLLNDVERKSQSLLMKASAVRASDIHLIPRRDDALIRFRIDGSLTDVDTTSKQFAEKLISHFKFLAGMDIGEKRRPQNGALDMRIHQQVLNLRLSTLPTPFSESLVLRLLPQEESHALADLSLFPQIHDQLLKLMDRENGLILLTGPTGSGKTTLLYALLNASVERLNRQVITIEDPIEKKHESFVQVEVNEKANITYAEGLKAILRHDPDMIMVGEIRDRETARMAVRASLTGHLVLSTVHTQDSLSSVYRLLELGIPASYLKETLIAVITQRLVDLVCPFCGNDCSPQCRERRDMRRLGLYELFTGQHLSSFMTSLLASTDHLYEPQFKKMEDLIKRGIAFGYLSEQSYDRWIGDFHGA